MTGFDKLPLELYDEILKHVFSFECDWSTLDERSRGRGKHPPDRVYPLCQRHTSPRKTRYSRDGRDVLSLRLVSRNFNQSILRAYYKIDGVFLVACEETSVRGFEKYILGAGDAATAGCDVAPHVERLVVELAEVSKSYRSGSLYNEESENQNDDIDAERQAELDAKAARLASVFEKDWFTKSIAKMPRLKELDFEFNEEWRCAGSAYDLGLSYDSEEDDSEPIAEVKIGMRLKLGLLENLRVGVASIFQSPAHLTSLQSLRLVLPSAYDIEFVATRMPNTVTDRLNHLHLEYIDGTGPQGDLYYSISYDSEDEYLYSNLQFEHRNEASMHAMCDLVNRCHNLTSLGLAGTQCIELDGLHWRQNPGMLKNTYLSRACISQESMKKLFAAEPSGKGPCRLAAVQLVDVQLWDGSWADVFSYLGTSNELLYVLVYNIIYNKDGESTHLARRNNRPWENSSVIWSEHEPDEKALEDLVREVRERGGGVSERLAEMADESDQKNKDEEEEDDDGHDKNDEDDEGDEDDEDDEDDIDEDEENDKEREEEENEDERTEVWSKDFMVGALPSRSSAAEVK